MAQDIGLIFGVEGGGHVSGKSGQLIQGQLNNILKSLNNATNSKANKIKLNIDVQNTKSAFTQSLKQITDGLSGQKQFKLRVTEIDAAPALASFHKQLETMLGSLKISSGFDVSIGADGSVGVVSGIKESLEGATVSAAALKASLKEIDSTNRAISSNYKSLKTALGSESATGENVEKVNQLKQKYIELTTAVETLRQKQDSATQGDIQNVYLLQSEMEKLITLTHEQVKASNEGAASGEKERVASLKQAVSLYGQIDTYLKNNSRSAGTEGYSSLVSMRDNLSDTINNARNAGTELTKMSKVDFGRMQTQFATTAMEIRNTGKEGKSLGTVLSSAFQKFGSWMLITVSLTNLVRMCKQMVTSVTAIDTAMTELKKVTDETDASYVKFLDNASTRSKAIGATLADTITATADFARLGYSISEAAELADAALVYKNVGDGIENVSVASESIISTMKAFGIEASNAISIVDAFNEVGNRFAVSSAGIGEALVRSASSLAAANNTMNESIALVTAMNSTVQNPEKVGTTLKTVSMYLRAAKIDAEAAGESTDGMATSVSKLRESVLALTKERVDIMLNETTFKSTYQIMKEISEVWNDMVDVDQAALLEMIGGKRNSDAVSSLINNFTIAEEALAAAAGSAGSAFAENEKYLDSIAGKMAIFKSSFESLSVSLINSDMVKGIVDAGTGLVNFITSLTDAFGAFPAVSAIVSAALTTQNVGWVKVKDSANLAGKEFTTAFRAMKESQALTLQKDLGHLESYNSEIKKLGDNSQNSIAKQEVWANTIGKGSKALRDTVSVTDTATVSTETYAATQSKATSATLAMTIGTRALSVAMQAAAVVANMLIGFGIALVATKVIGWVTDLVKAKENARKAAMESADAYNTEIASIEQQKSKIAELKTALESGNLSHEDAYNKRLELIGIQDQLVAAYGSEIAQLNLLSMSADEAAAALDSVSAAMARENLNTNHSAIKDSIKGMESVGNIGFQLGWAGSELDESGLRKSIDAIISKYKDAFLFAEDNGDGTQSLTLRINADPQNAKETINGLANDFKNLSKDVNIFGGTDTEKYFIGDGFSKEFEKILGENQKIIDKHGKSYNQQIEWKIVATPEYGEAVDAIEKTKVAFNQALSGAFDTKDDKNAAIKQSILDMKDAYSDFLAMDFADGDAGVKNKIQAMYDEFKRVAANEIFRVEYELALNDGKVDIKDIVQQKINNALSQLKREDNSIDIFEILNLGVELENKLSDLSDYTPNLNEQAYLDLKSFAAAAGISVEDLLNNMIELGVVGGQVSQKMYEVGSAIQALSTGTADLKSQADLLNKIYAEQGSNGALTLDSYRALIALSEDYASCIGFENGSIQLNIEKARELNSAKAELKLAEIELQKATDIQRWKDNSATIEKLQSRYGSLKVVELAYLSALQSENDAIVRNVQEYNILKSELIQLTGAYQAWQDAQSAPESGDMYDNLKKARDQIREGIETGKTGKGSPKYTTAVELLIPEANREDVVGYLNSVEKYLADGKAGVVSFIQDMLSEGLMIQDGEMGSIIPDLTIEEVCERLKITPEMAKGIFGELEEYPIDIHWSDEDFDLAIKNFDIAEVQAKIDLVQSQIDVLTSSDLSIETDSTEIIELQTELDELKQKKSDIENDVIKAKTETNAETTKQSLLALSRQVSEASAKVMDLAKKRIGTLGASTTINALTSIYNNLVAIDDKKISNKSFTVTETHVTVSKSKGVSGGSGAYGTTNSPGGTTLVGELGTELVVSGNRYYTVGDFGAEFVNLKKGDIVFNHRDTARLLAGYEGIRGTALAEGNAAATIVSGGGNISNLIGGWNTASKAPVNSTKTNSSANITVDVKIDDTTLEERLKDTLEAMKKTISRIIGDFEHDIFLLEKNGGSAEEIISIYKRMQEAIHNQANEYRAKGLSEDSDYIQELQKQWWDYQEKMAKVRSDVIDKVINDAEHEIFMLSKNGASTQEQIDIYRQIQSILHEEAQEYRAQGIEENSKYIQELQKQWWDYQEKLSKLRQDEFNDYIDDRKFAIDVLVSNNVDTSTILTFWRNILKSINDEIEYYTSIGYDMTSDVMQSLIKEAWNVEAEMNSVLDSLVKNAQDAVNDLQNVYKTLQDAAAEYIKTGYISVDTLQSIIDLGVEYLAFLKDENGQLVINEENIHRIIAAKTQQLAVDSALNYVQQLRIALESGQTQELERLLTATNSAADATWGLVYASLALLNLPGSQYAQALSNINALRSLADNAVVGIPVTEKNSDYYKEAEDALDRILDLTMDLIKHEKEQQIKALKDQIDKYKEIIKLKKESLKASKEENDYNKEVAKRIKDIANLQTRIDKLKLEGTRESLAEAARLQEELAEKQENLADYQANYSLDRQQEALDAEVDAYEAAKNKEIQILEDSISSTEKIYRLAIDRISSNWDGLYADLLAWNYEYGNNLESEIVTAWNAASRAVQEYGSYLDALNAITAINNSSQGGGSQGSAGGTTIGNNDYAGSTVSDIDMVRAIMAQMRRYAAQWNVNNPQTLNDALHGEAVKLMAQMAQHGVEATYDPPTGTWTIIRDRLNPSNAGKTIYECYHTGGIVGATPTLKDNEVLSKLERDEVVLDEPKKEGLYNLFDFVSALSERLGSTIDASRLNGFLGSGRGLLPSISSLPELGSTTNSIVINPEINIEINHSGSLSDSDAARLGKIAADNTIGELTNAFSRRGISYIGNAVLKR